MQLICLVLIPDIIFSADIYWTDNAGDENWFNAANWNPMQVPGLPDNVYLINPPSGSLLIEITSGTAQCNNLFFNGTGYTINIDDGAIFEIGGDVTLDNGNIIENRGIMDVDFDLHCYGYFDNY